MRPWRRAARAGDEGFTLVELVVAMFVIAVVLLLLAGVQISATQTILNASKRQQATAYANQAMEIMRALPWDTLSKGNVPGFQSAGGNSDPYYSGTNLAGSVSIDGGTYAVRLATSTSQDLSNPRPPLFDATGSNHAVMEDPARPGTTYDVRAYVVNSLDGSAASVGLLVIVSWKNVKTGATDDLALRSSAYPGSEGCGDKSELPYLVACQDRLAFAATSGFISSSVTASDPVSSTDTPLVPTTSFQEIALRSALIAANGDSVQVSTMNAETRRGGTTVKQFPVSPTASPTIWKSGFESILTGATNNYAVTTGLPQDDTESIGVAASTAQWAGNGSMLISARADDARTGTSRSNTTQACLSVQLFAGEPCTYTELTGSGSLSSSMWISGAAVNPLWRNGMSTSAAGGGRFVASSPGTQYGCQTLATSGCASGRASFSEQSLQFGRFSGSTWNEGVPWLIEIADYSDSVLVQRGSVQTTTAATMTRSANIRYWDGTSTQTVALTAGSSGTLATTAPVTWSPAGGITVTASGTVTASAVSSQQLGEDPVVDCRTDTCALNANAGTVTVTILYHIETPTATWDINHQTVLSGSAASASFDRRT